MVKRESGSLERAKQEVRRLSSVKKLLRGGEEESPREGAFYRGVM